MSKKRWGVTSNMGLKLYHGTTVIAFLKDDIGWIAADSKVTTITAEGIVSKNVKKIEERKNIFYAFAEVPVARLNDQVIYDAYDIMDETINQEQDFTKSFDAFDARIIIKLQECLDIIVKENELGFIIKYTRQSFLSFIMVQFQQGKRFFQHKSYKFELHNGVYNVVEEPPLMLIGAYPFMLLGSSNAAIEYLRLNPKFLLGFTEMKEKLIFLIAQEIKANPLYVGFPINVVEITDSSQVWSLDNMNCPIQY
jgi:hypothetical protein